MCVPVVPGMAVTMAMAVTAVGRVVRVVMRRLRRAEFVIESR